MNNKKIGILQENELENVLSISSMDHSIGSYTSFYKNTQSNEVD